LDEIEGAQGELIDRLIDILNDDGEWYEFSTYAVGFLGGEVLQRAVPDTGREPTPNTYGWWRRLFGDPVARDEYFELIQDRFVELVNSGLDEEFLVQSVRDGIRQILVNMADVGEVDRKNAEMKADIGRMLEDPAEFAAFRARLAASGNEVPGDEQITARLRRMAEAEVLRPLSADAVADRWATLETWDNKVALLLSDDVFEQWLRLRGNL